MTYFPAVQALLTAAQAPTPDALLYVWPTTHAAHWRSALALPTADRPWPMAHSCQVAHNALLAVDLNLPVEQAPHTRSLEFVAAAVSSVPAAHVVATRAHEATLSVAL